MEANLKNSARGGIKGKVVTVYSKYTKPQNISSVSVTQAYAYQPNYSSSIDVATATNGSYGGVNNVDERATAYILAVRERFKKEWM
uniref:Uncharacterized protein n=1 Tax=Leersia perrieri TaxID=77586 RepID=A0A0D9V9N8_9ORYZ